MTYKDCLLKKTYTLAGSPRIEIWLDGRKIGQAPTWSKATDKVDLYWQGVIADLKTLKVV